MSLDIKVEENKRVAKKCKDIGAYNAGATRAYYAAFQRAKSYLEKSDFDYMAFLGRIGTDKNERAYSHGTIQRAVIECMMSQGKTRAEIYKLNIWDNLYNKRIKADYYTKLIELIDMEECLRELDAVLGIIPTN